MIWFLFIFYDMKERKQNQVLEKLDHGLNFWLNARWWMIDIFGKKIQICLLLLPPQCTMRPYFINGRLIVFSWRILSSVISKTLVVCVIAAVIKCSGRYTVFYSLSVFWVIFSFASFGHLVLFHNLLKPMRTVKLHILRSSLESIRIIIYSDLMRLVRF